MQYAINIIRWFLVIMITECVLGKKQNFYNKILILEGGDYLFQAYLSTLMMCIFNIYWLNLALRMKLKLLMIISKKY